MKNLIYSIFVLFCVAFLASCTQKTEKVIPIKANLPLVQARQYADVPDTEDLVASFSSRTDGVFYEVLPDNYLPEMAGVWDYANVYLFITT